MDLKTLLVSILSKMKKEQHRLHAFENNETECLNGTILNSSTTLSIVKVPSLVSHRKSCKISIKKCG